MKILYVTPETPFEKQPGGIGTYIKEVLRGWNKLGVEYKILRFGWDDSGEDKQTITYPDFVETVSISERNFGEGDTGHYFTIASELIANVVNKIVATWKPDVIEACDFGAPLYSYLERCRCGEYQKRSIISTFYHGSWRDTWINDFNYPSDINAIEVFAREEKQLRWSDIIISPSEYARAHIKRTYDIDSEVIREPYTFVPDNQFENFDDKRLVVSSVGRFDISKGADSFVFVLNQLENAGVKPKEIKIVGKLGFSTFKYGSLDKLLDKLSVSNKKRLTVCGEYDRDNLYDILADVKFNFSLSRSETFGYTIPECLECGVLPITYTGSAMEEFYPAHLLGGLLPTPYPSQEEIINAIAFWDSKKCSSVLEYNINLLKPEKVCKDIISLYEIKLSKFKTRARNSYKQYCGKDVTAIIAHYNDTDNLRNILKAIKEQNVSFFDTLVCDDGSSVPEKKKLFDLQLEFNFHIISLSSNLGLCAVRNILLSNVSTDLIVFCDSDDTIEKDYLERCIEAINFSGADAVVPWRRNFGLNNSLYRFSNTGTIYHFLYNDLRMTSLIKTDIARNIGFEVSERFGEADDWEFWIAFSDRGYNLVTIPRPLFNYRFSHGTMSWPWSIGQGISTTFIISRKMINISKNQLHRLVLERELFNLTKEISSRNNKQELSTTATQPKTNAKSGKVQKIRELISEAENLSDEVFLKSCYNSILDRDPDQDGYNFYFKRLKNENRYKIICDFIASKEIPIVDQRLIKIIVSHMENKKRILFKNKNLYSKKFLTDLIDM